MCYMNVDKSVPHDSIHAVDGRVGPWKLGFKEGAQEVIFSGDV
jgi:hypothetical protein